LRYGIAMAAAPARERLARLVDLASQSEMPARELTDELANLLLDWPANYPLAMREPFEALLEKSLRDIDPAARALLAQRFADGTMPLSVLNTLIFDADPEARQAILARNATEVNDATAARMVDERDLLAAARAGTIELPLVLTLYFGIPRDVAAKALADRSGFSLALLCSGIGCSRAAFSALAVLASPQADTDESYRRLAAYDHVPENGAAALMQFWRSQLAAAQPAAA
jgi:hypothetical protein